MITLTFTIQLESVDLTDLLSNADLSRLIAALPTPPPPPTPSAPPRTLTPTPSRSSMSLRKPAKAAPEPERTERPTLNETPVLVPDIAEVGPALEIAPILPATQVADDAGETTRRKTRPREPLPYAEFDRLVRKEIKRLSMDGRMPGFKLWDSERDQRLPTLGAVLHRYGLKSNAELATLMGVEPPLRSNSIFVKHPEPEGESHEPDEI